LEIRNRLREYIIGNFLFGATDKSFQDDDSFLENGIIDSTGILELVSYLEEHFEFEVLDEELVPDNFDSLKKLVSYIDSKKN